MADFMFVVVVIVGFFALWALVIGCDRIVGTTTTSPRSNRLRR